MKSIFIKNFKNIRELTFNKLAKVNLIVGKNSVGKSALLEAMSIYLANGSEDWLRELLANRGEAISIRPTSEEWEEINAQHYLSLFAERKEDYSKDFNIIIGETEKDEESVKINQVFISTRGGIEDELMMNRRIVSAEDLMNDDSIQIEGRGLAVTVGKKYTIIPYNKLRSFSKNENRVRFQYVHTIDFRTNKNSSLFDNIALSPEEQYIIRALQIINPHIERINFLNSENDRMGRKERVPVVTLKGDSRKFLLSSMGDGINRILTIILAMLNCKDGVLLLDEFETGLHYSVQGELWKIIFMLSEELNVQVFATSHSTDCIRSFASVNEQSKGMLFRLEKRKDEIVAVTYTDNEELKFATTNNIEIR